MAPEPPPAVRRGRWLTLAALLALIALCLGWELLWAPTRPGGSWLALKAVPLLLPLAGVLRHRLYTYRWLSLLVWLYFAEGAVRATSEGAPGAWLAALEIALSLALFAACVGYIRLRLRPTRAANAR